MVVVNMWPFTVAWWSHLSDQHVIWSGRIYISFSSPVVIANETIHNNVDLTNHFQNRTVQVVLSTSDSLFTSYVLSCSWKYLPTIPFEQRTQHLARAKSQPLCMDTCILLGVCLSGVVCCQVLRWSRINLDSFARSKLLFLYALLLVVFQYCQAT